ncbi:MAG TPA: O-methyltransferase [Polyangiaceae bacterium]
MTQETWSAVDENFLPLVGEDAALREATVASHEGGLPPIQVAPNQGKLLYMLATLRGARNILEVGTLGGYSTIWLARALPEGGTLTTLEIDPKHAEVASKNLARAGLDKKVRVRVGKASETLEAMRFEKREPFDFTFIDADKPSNLDYFDRALDFSRPGSLIVVDNIARAGKVADAQSTDANVLGVRRLRDALAKNDRVTATAIQTVGSKGYDGFVLAIVK